GRMGNFSVFGFGGFSDQKFEAKKDSSEWESNDDRYSFKFKMFTGATGIVHTIPLSSSAYLRTTLSGSITDKVYDDERVMEDYTSLPNTYQNYTQNRLSLTSILTKKINTKISLKAGVTGNKLFYSFLDKEVELPSYSRNVLIDRKGSAYEMPVQGRGVHELGRSILPHDPAAGLQLEPHDVVTDRLVGKDGMVGGARGIGPL